MAVGLVLTVVGTALPGSPAGQVTSDMPVAATAATSGPAASLEAAAPAAPGSPEAAAADIQAAGSNGDASAEFGPASVGEKGTDTEGAHDVAASGDDISGTRAVSTPAPGTGPEEDGPVLAAGPEGSGSLEPDAGDVVHAAVPSTPGAGDTVAAGAVEATGPEPTSMKVLVTPASPAADEDGNSAVTAARVPQATPTAPPVVATAAGSPASGTPFPAVVLLGLVLAVVGSGILVLGMVARRLGDPLLR